MTVGLGVSVGSGVFVGTGVLVGGKEVAVGAIAAGGAVNESRIHAAAAWRILPLLMAGVHISPKIKMEGEDVKHSLALMKKAREARQDLFLDEDMAQADQIFNQIMKKALA